MSSLSNSIPPIDVGKADSATQHSANLGKLYEVGGKVYRLVKMSASLSAAAKKVIVSAVSAGAKTWACTTSTTANDHTAVGVIPAGQTGSDGTTALASGDYLLVQVSGCCDVLSAAAVAAGALVGTSTTAGKADDASIDAIGAIGRSLESAAAADESMGIELRGLI